jgi:hypothetical protein
VIYDLKEERANFSEPPLPSMLVNDMFRKSIKPLAGYSGEFRAVLAVSPFFVGMRLVQFVVCTA